MGAAEKACLQPGAAAAVTREGAAARTLRRSGQAPSRTNAASLAMASASVAARCSSGESTTSWHSTLGTSSRSPPHSPSSRTSTGRTACSTSCGSVIVGRGGLRRFAEATVYEAAARSKQLLWPELHCRAERELYLLAAPIPAAAGAGPGCRQLLAEVGEADAGQKAGVWG